MWKIDLQDRAQEQDVKEEGDDFDEELMYGHKITVTL